MKKEEKKPSKLKLNLFILMCALFCALMLFSSSINTYVLLFKDGGVATFLFALLQGYLAFYWYERGVQANDQLKELQNKEGKK